MGERLAEAVVGGIALGAAVGVKNAGDAVLAVAGVGGGVAILILLREHKAEVVARPDVGLDRSAGPGDGEQPPSVVAGVGRGLEHCPKAVLHGAGGQEALAPGTVAKLHLPPEHIRLAADVVRAAKVKVFGAAIRIGGLAAHVAGIVGPHALEFCKNVEGSVEPPLGINVATDVGAVPEFVADFRRGAGHARVIHAEQERALSGPLLIVGVLGAGAVAIGGAAEHEPARTEGVGHRRIAVTDRAGDDLAHAGAIAYFDRPHERLRDRRGVRALEKAVLHPPSKASTRVKPHLADLRRRPAAEINAGIAKVHIGIVKEGAGIAVEGFVEGVGRGRGIRVEQLVVRIAPPCRAGAKGRAGELGVILVVEFDLGDIAIGLHMTRVGRVIAQITEGSRIGHGHFRPGTVRIEGIGNRREGRPLVFIHGNGLVGEAQPAPAGLADEDEIAAAIVGELIEMARAIGEILQLIVVIHTIARELLEMVGRPIRLEEIVVGAALGEDIGIRGDAGPDAAIERVVVARAAGLGDAEHAAGKRGHFPLIGVPPDVPVAKRASATDKPAVAVTCPVQPMGAHAGQGHNVLHVALHIARGQVHGIHAAARAGLGTRVGGGRHLTVLAGLAGLAGVIQVVAAVLRAGLRVARAGLRPSPQPRLAAEQGGDECSGDRLPPRTEGGWWVGLAVGFHRMGGLVMLGGKVLAACGHARFGGDPEGDDLDVRPEPDGDAVLAGGRVGGEAEDGFALCIEGQGEGMFAIGQFSPVLDRGGEVRARFLFRKAQAHPDLLPGADIDTGKLTALIRPQNLRGLLASLHPGSGRRAGCERGSGGWHIGQRVSRARGRSHQLAIVAEARRRGSVARCLGGRGGGMRRERGSGGRRVRRRAAPIQDNKGNEGNGGEGGDDEAEGGVFHRITRLGMRWAGRSGGSGQGKDSRESVP